MGTVIWQVQHVERIAPALLDGLDVPPEKPFAVIRTGPTRAAIWGFHNSRANAERAMRRARAREIVTR